MYTSKLALELDSGPWQALFIQRNMTGAVVCGYCDRVGGELAVLSENTTRNNECTQCRSIVIKGITWDRGYWMTDTNVRLLMHFIFVFSSQDMPCPQGCHGNGTSSAILHDITLFHILQVLPSKTVHFPQLRGQRRFETLPSLNAQLRPWGKHTTLFAAHNMSQQPNKVRIYFIQRHFLYSVKGHGLIRSNTFNEAVSCK